MEAINLKVEGMECAGCEKRIQNAVSNVTGVKEVKANHENGTVIVTAKNGVDIEEIKNKINDLGFEVI